MTPELSHTRLKMCGPSRATNSTGSLSDFFKCAVEETVARSAGDSRE